MESVDTKGNTLAGAEDALAQCTQWMIDRDWQPAVFQRDAWHALLNGQEGIVNAPTGSGKTYSLLLPFILKKRKGAKGLRLLWVTPIRALAKEIELAAQRVIASTQSDITVAIRTGDSDQETKDRVYQSPPDILITTPAPFSRTPRTSCFFSAFGIARGR